MTDTSASKRSDFPCPAIHRDQMRPIRSMADGKTYESKSDYFDSLKQNNCRVVEDGE